MERPNRFSVATWLKQPTVRDHFAATGLAVGLFIIIFFKALTGEYHYGILPQQQLMGITWQNPWIGQKDLPLTERQPMVVDPDYHFLYELDAIAAARELRAGHLPFFDVGRMLGVPLWGSIIFDFGNPLNLFLKFFSPQAVHLIKILFCMVLAANGFVTLMRELGARTSTAWVTATLLYLGTNYAVYWFHWIGAYGVTCVAPMLLGMLLRFLRTGSPGSFLGIFCCACFVVIAHCTQIGIHLVILSAVVCVAMLWVQRHDWKVMVTRIVLLGFAGICSAVACYEILSQVALTSADSSRLASKLIYHGYPYVESPQVHQAYSTFFCANVDTSGSYWETLFFPWPAMLCFWAVFSGSQTRRREVVVLGWLALFFTIFFFVGWIDAPLYPLLGKLYAPNPMAWRGMLSFYLPIAALAGLGAEVAIFEPLGKRLRIFVWIGLGVIALLGAGASVLRDTWVPGNILSRSGLFFDSYIKSWGFWLVLGGTALWSAVMLFKNAALKRALIIASAALICIGIPAGRVPFYRTSNSAQVSRGDPADINTPRIARLIPGTEYLLGAVNIENRYVLDSPLSTLGLKMLNGYHTSMSKPELKVFDALVSEHHLQARESGMLRSYSFGFYRTFLDGRGVVENNTLRPDKTLLLMLLGVDYIVDGVGLSKINSQTAFDFSKWPSIRLPVTTVSHFIEGIGQKDLLALFAGSLDRQTVSNMVDRIKPFKLETTPNGHGYRATLSGASGTVVVPYHFGRFFQVTLDNKPVPEPDDLGACIVEVSAQNKLLEIRPHRSGIVGRTLIALLIGCLLAVAGAYMCNRLATPRSSVSPAKTDPALSTPPTTPGKRKNQ